jgi:hypothetical protein
MYGDPALRLPAETMDHLKRGWADSTHAERKVEFLIHQEMIHDVLHDAELQAAKEHAEREKKRENQ